uniref:Ig-like domain-containing protein n=1 Tax=Sinocyclocheilus rhinocerous TaxID=307959 RepID=A0A673M0W4_9TELE
GVLITLLGFIQQMTANEAAQVTLLCNYSTSFSNAYLFWYKQLPNRSPTFILKEFKKRFNASLNTQAKSVPLTIQDVCVSDSAVYYCALRPTVTETHSTLTQKHISLTLTTNA